MFKFIFDFLTEPLGLPIEWYYEWIILAIIGIFAYVLAFEKVGKLYHGGIISRRASGSFFHWVIRTVYFVVMWAVTYGVIWIGKLILSHKLQTAVVCVSAIVIVALVKLVIWIKERKELVKEPVKIKNDEKQ